MPEDNVAQNAVFIDPSTWLPDLAECMHYWLDAYTHHITAHSSGANGNAHIHTTHPHCYTSTHSHPYSNALPSSNGQGGKRCLRHYLFPLGGFTGNLPHVYR